ncbi:hypothetical protein [Aliiglaciecola sp. LCG003]|uniref:hypothetical protein n=1 Tax=Aliiglaciecola sp. LCG003 TaxID=3053655 RepID=UPI0025724EAD|nr:hypothetical protein [Aliiglaciecola sp. LCG003]WJG08457.1 hypothetical protein QR722_14070 [Aliiglaciecola sp. LCG003]
MEPHPLSGNLCKQYDYSLTHLSDKHYAVVAGSVVTWLQDGSGIAIYNAYNGDTTFLHAQGTVKADLIAVPIPASITLLNLIEWLELSTDTAEHTLQQLIERKVLREQV